MTRLDQLIQRIEYPIKVSTEDAIDVVKQYWDDAANTVSSYWNDTDDEVADEIGVPKPTLSQLLDQHGNGTAYANRGGNSGVDSYVTGEDWILVNFTTGAKYLYTQKSTAYENIEQMKRYAEEGRGLNSFIMRISKDGYAGRNIKGTILVRPGMEHYRQQANKRLQLLYAFRNAKMNTVSNESIFDAIKRLFVAERNEEKKPVTPQITYVWDTAAQIEKSPPKQLLETSSNAAIFQVNGAYNPNWLAQLDSDIRQYERITKELTAYDRKLSTWYKKWDAKFDEFLGDVDRKDEFVAVLKDAIKEQPEPWYTVFRNNHEFLGWGKYRWDGEYGFGDNPMQSAPTVKIPLVNEANTRQVVAMIAKLGKFLLGSYDLSDKLAYVSYDFTDPPFRGYVFEDDVGTVLNGFKYQMDAANTSLDHFEVIEDRIEQILKALVAYVKSAESNSIGNEVYMHNTINTYQAQLAKAGDDGLDTTARQFMAIGLESIAQVEAEPLYLPGTDVASMEGIWDSIKDFFAGRPEKIHLSGADKGLREKLNRTINDRTWLSRQKYTLGEVNFRALPEFNPVSARKYVQDYKLAVNSTTQHNSREMAKIKERLEAVPRMVMLYASRDIFDTGLIETVINDINPYRVRLNINIQEPALMSTEMTTQMGQALTKVEIKEFAEMIAQVHAIQSAYDSSIRVSSSVPWMEQARFRYAHKPGGPEVLAAIRRAVQAYEEVVLLINREIKQRVTTHAAWINAENIADSLVNYIGKSITNVSTNSFESFNAPIVPSTEELKATCASLREQEMSVSNEGIWGAVKYLFGGNYENLPKINAAYDEAVDAVKATYANPQWVKGRRLNTDKPIKIEYFSEVAANPAKAFEKVKQANHKAVEGASNYVKEEVAYLSKFTKALSSGDEAKIKALLDMFEVRKPRDLDVAEEVDFDDGETVKGLSAEGIHKAAEVFIEAVKYRRITDALYTQGMYKLMYTDSGKVRYGNGGEVTGKLSGAAKELAIKIGESADNVEKSFFNAFTPAWDNVDAVVRGTLQIMEASAK